jgi:hypothetical protein
MDVYYPYRDAKRQMGRSISKMGSQWVVKIYNG